MEENLEIVKQNLDNLTITAPVSGQLTSLNAEIGDHFTIIVSPLRGFIHPPVSCLQSP